MKPNSPTLTALIAAGFAWLAVGSSAHGAFFDLRDQVSTFPPGNQTIADLEGESMTLQVGGITATLTADVTGGGVLNQSGSAFGVNQSDAGDDADQLDAVNGVESIIIAFDSQVTAESILVSSFGSEDKGVVTSPGKTDIIVDSTGITDISSFGLISQFTIAFVDEGGNGFSFDGFTVTPEPAGLALLSLGAPALLRRRAA